MSLKLFGWEFRRQQQEEYKSFVPKEIEDGAVVVAAAGGYGISIDLDGVVRSEAELITRYREMSTHPEVDSAIEEITNEAVTKNDNDEIVKIFLDKVDLSKKLKDRIQLEFNNCLNLLKFNERYHDIFRRWYIDGRLTYHVIIDEKKPQEGIKEFRFIDPRKIRKVREVIRRRFLGDAIPDGVVQTRNEYYIYNTMGFNVGIKSVMPTTAGLKIAKDAILQVTSGLTDTNGQMVLSYLHKAVKPLNQLRTLEDAVVIYRISRAPERRVWYIDVGQLPKMKAEQYMRDLMVKHKNRLIYDGHTGEIRDDRKFQTMLEDYWLPQREGKGTKVDTLEGGKNLGEMEDVNYFLRKLYNSLNVPLARLDSQSVFMSGRPSEITREELKFGKFVERLRARFAQLFFLMLEKQLVLKNVFTIEEWEVLKPMIEFTFIKDSYFTEMKEQDVLMSRMNIIQMMDPNNPVVGRYYSHEWIRKNVLKQNDDEIEEIDAEIAEEQEQYQYLPEEQKMMMAQQEMEMQANQQQAQMEQEQEVQAAGGEQEHRQLVDAKKSYEELKQVKNRSMSDEAKYKSAAQKLSKAGLLKQGQG